jgi:hypothetical protein
MQRMQRITGRFLTRTPNEADVEAMLQDFTDSQTMLEKVRSVWLIISHCSVLRTGGAMPKLIMFLYRPSTSIDAMHSVVLAQEPGAYIAIDFQLTCVPA